LAKALQGGGDRGQAWTKGWAGGSPLRVALEKEARIEMGTDKDGLTQWLGSGAKVWSKKKAI